MTAMAEHFIPVGAPTHRRVMSRLETALAARRNVLEIIPALAYRQPIVSGEMLMRWHMLADPAGYRRVMSDNLANYPKSEIMRRMLRPAIGESLFNADGADWRWQRRAVTPVFTHRNVVTLAPAMTATAERASARLKGGRRAEMVGEMLTATFDVICDVALSGREHFDGRAFSAAISRYFQTAGRASLLDFLKSQPPQSLDRFVLLDAQDWMTPAQLTALWTQIDRTAHSRDARVIFRTAGEASPLPQKLAPDVLAPWLYHEWQSRVLHAQDRSSIYGGFHIYARRPLS